MWIFRWALWQFFGNISFSFPRIPWSLRTYDAAVPSGLAVAALLQVDSVVCVNLAAMEAAKPKMSVDASHGESG